MRGRFSNRTKGALCAVLAFALVASPPAAAQTSGAAAQAIDHYFQAAGGRELWANAAGEYVLAVTNDPRLPGPYTFEFCWSFREPRTAERARFQNRTQLRGFERGRGWSFRRDVGAAQGTVRPWSAEENANGDDIWRGAFEVVVHRLAARDPALSVHMGQGPWEGYVEIVEGAAPIGRLLLNEEGEPLRYQRVIDDTRVVFGPQAERGGFRFPKGGSFEIGATFEIIALELLPSEPRGVYAQPQITHDGAMLCR